VLPHLYQKPPLTRAVSLSMQLVLKLQDNKLKYYKLTINWLRVNYVLFHFLATDLIFLISANSIQYFHCQTFSHIRLTYALMVTLILTCFQFHVHCTRECNAGYSNLLYIYLKQILYTDCMYACIIYCNCICITSFNFFKYIETVTEIKAQQ